MKNLLYMFLFSLSLCCCINDDDNPPTNPIDLLPPATQTGANTFGCLLDGEAFLPGNGPNPLDCTYQFVDGGYYFTLQANRRDSSNNLVRLGVDTDNLEIFENGIFQLKEKIIDNASGKYFFNNFINYTTNQNGGELLISKLDIENNIVSGTFWYDIQDSNGVVHQIREGRFDMQFTQ